MLLIDASRCEHESHICLSIPKTSASLAAADGGSIIRLGYQLIACDMKVGDLPRNPLSDVSLIEHCGSSENRVHRLKKKLALTKHKGNLEFSKEYRECEQYILSVRVVPGADPFGISMVSLRIKSLSSPSSSVSQVGSRIQGSFPENLENAKLYVYADGSRASINLEDSDEFTLHNFQGYVHFDVSALQLRGLLPGYDAMEAFVALSIHGRLSVGGRCDLPSLPDGALLSQTPSAERNDELLAAAELNIRQGRNYSGIALLDRLTDPSPDQKRRAARWGVPAWLRERCFEEAISLFEASNPLMRDDFKAYPSYIEACLSGGHIEKGRAELESILFGLKESTPKFLAKLYRFSSLLGDQHRSIFAERLLAVADELRPFVGSIIHLGHDFANRRDLRAFFQVVAVLGKFDLHGIEKANFSLLLAQLAHHVGDLGQFLERLNEALGHLQATPVSLIDANLGISLNNLRAQSLGAHSSGPLVSVLMTAYNAEATIHAAITSILDQSYQDLELIVVDDCSCDRTPAIITELAAKDKRVSPVFAHRNAGTYPSKNFALSRARGEFVTCHDSDDWAHPQRIETSVNRLRSAPGSVATGTQVVRFSESRGLQFRRDYVQLDAPSLMYRAEPVRRSLGFYDSVRAAGDIEFESRMRHVFGSTAVHRGQELLTIGSWSDETLTGGGPFAINNDTALAGRIRDDYRREFGRWHARSGRLYLDFPLKCRPFPAPEEILAVPSML